MESSLRSGNFLALVVFAKQAASPSSGHGDSSNNNNTGGGNNNNPRRRDPPRTTVVYVDSPAAPVHMVAPPAPNQVVYTPTPSAPHTPHITTTAGGDRSLEGQIINDLIPPIDSTYRTRATRDGRAIGGISRGGVWSLEIGFRHADMFAAVGGHSPALKYNLAPEAYDPFYLLDHPGVPELRIYLDAGDTDWALEDTQALHEALDAKGIPNQFVVHSGGHSDSLWDASVGEYLAFYAAGW